MLESFMVQFGGDRSFSLEEMGFSAFVWYVWFSSEDGISVLLCLVIL
jgi:hypothetical protein